MRSRELHPVLLVACLALISLFAVALRLAGVGLHPAQQLTALVVVAFFVVAVLLSHVNGLVLLFLLPPLFNGEDQRPYFWLLGVLVALTLAVGFGRLLWRRERPRFPYAFFFLLFLASTIASFPLDVTALWLQLQVQSWREILHAIRRADLSEDIFYVRTVLNVGSGIGLYVLAASRPFGRDAVVRVATGVAVIHAAVNLAGLWFPRHPASPVETFLTVWLGSPLLEGGRGFAGLGFNVSYFAQYALAYLPFSVLVLAERTSAWPKAVALANLGLSGYSILATGQRGAYLVLVVQIAFLCVVWLALVRQTDENQAKTARGTRIAVAGIVAALLGVMLWTTLGSYAVTRVVQLLRQGDAYRRSVLAASWRMFLDHPLLGLGAGQFAGQFPSYDPDPTVGWGSLSSHLLYAQLLAEQGVIGLLAFLGILVVAVAPVWRRRRDLGERLASALLVQVSIVSWLVYGFFQFTFLMFSMQVYFWIALAWLIGLGPRPARRETVSRARWIPVVLSIVLLAIAFRIYESVNRPIRPGYTWGLHDWAGVGGVRWTRGGAVLSLPVGGRTLRLDLTCPVVPLTGRAQTVSVFVDGTRVSMLTLHGAQWSPLLIPMTKPPGAPIILQFKVGYVFTPAQLGLSDDPRRFGVLMKPIAWLDG